MLDITLALTEQAVGKLLVLPGPILKNFLQINLSLTCISYVTCTYFNITQGPRT